MSNWHTRYSFPVSFDTGPIKWFNPAFDNLFIRIGIYEELDKYLNVIQSQYGKFWISGPSGGYGKSTMLHYVTRALYSNIRRLRALPLLISVGKKTPLVENTFFRDFLNEFLRLPQNLAKASNVLNVVLPEDIQKYVLDWFKKSGTEDVRKIQKELATVNLEELERRFYVVLEKVFNHWADNGVFSKYVLLVDEMDKLADTDVLPFLGSNQNLFQELYQEHRFVVFISGHSSWIERIRDSTTEYSFFRGKVLRIPQFEDIPQIEELVLSRLVQHLHMIPSDNPWRIEGYEELRELSGGVPRSIIQLAEMGTNEAQRRNLATVGSGILKEIVVTEDNIKPIEDYIHNHPETYSKLRDAVDKHVDALLYVFYDMPGHKIFKEYDRNLANRTRYVGIEISDEDWIKKVNMLTIFECLVDDDTHRELSRDLCDLFDKLGQYPALIGKVVPSIVKKLGDIKPRFPSGKPTPPKCQDIIENIFRVHKNLWSTQEEIFGAFRDSPQIKNYALACKTSEGIGEFSRALFEKEFQRYIQRAASSLMIFEEGEKIYYRRFPEGMQEDDYSILKVLGSREVLNNYIDLMISPIRYDSITIKRLDRLIENILCAIADSKGAEFQQDCLHKKSKWRIFENLELDPNLRRRLDFYSAESKKEPKDVDIIQKISKQIIIDLAKEYEEAKKLPRPIPINFRELLEKGENEKIEFKSSMSFDIREGKKSDLVEIALAKAVACFMNSEGGTLLIGIGDNKEVLGLDRDFEVIRKPNTDGFELHFNGLVKRYLSPKESRRCVKLSFSTLDGKSIAVARVDRSQRPVFVKSEGKTLFFARFGSECTPLDIDDATKYIADHFRRQK